MLHIENEVEKRTALEILAAKYSPDHRLSSLKELDKFFSQVCAVELAIEHMTGKAAIELVSKKHNSTGTPD